MRIPTLIATLAIAQASLADENADLVMQFIGAFNEKNVDAMLAIAAPDMRWMSVMGDQVAVETSTHAELRAAMESYFESTPGTRAEIRAISEGGPFIHTLEEAFWTSGGTERSQCSMAVYELSEQYIQNVWYFPSHACP